MRDDPPNQVILPPSSFLLPPSGYCYLSSGRWPGAQFSSRPQQRTSSFLPVAASTCLKCELPLCTLSATKYSSPERVSRASRPVSEPSPCSTCLPGRTSTRK